MMQIQKISFEREDDYLEIKEMLEKEAQKVGFWAFPLGQVAVYHYNGLTVRLHNINDGISNKFKIQVFK
ncbi:MAG: hypothetical protein KJ767_00345 [Nanoarchaeota archaeon]|nr:hypothetical protein [Nanoarchaeota archaeon]